MTEPCPYCRGSGRVELSPEYLATLVALNNAGEIHAAELARRMSEPCSGEAMSMRLKALERKGLALSRRAGRRVLYTAKLPKREGK